jgi:hypothetical protein
MKSAGGSGPPWRTLVARPPLTSTRLELARSGHRHPAPRRRDDRDHARPGPPDGSAAHVPAPAAEHPGGLGDQLHRLVRGDLLGLSRDQVGVRHGAHLRDLPRVHRRHRDLVRQPRRPPPQEDRDAVVGGGLAAAVRRVPGALPDDPRGDVPRPGQPAAVGVRRPADARGGGRQPAHDRDAHPRDPAHPRGPPGQGQRAGRHGDGPLVPGHVRDQRPAGRRRRHVLRAAAGDRRAGTRDAAPRLRRRPGDATGAAGPWRGRGRGRHTRHRPVGPRRARVDRPDRVLVLQQTSSAARSWR